MEESDYSPVFLVLRKNTSYMIVIINVKVLDKDYLVHPAKFQMESVKKLRQNFSQIGRFGYQSGFTGHISA